jgi:hypothetical protein
VERQFDDRAPGSDAELSRLYQKICVQQGDAARTCAPVIGFPTAIYTDRAAAARATSVDKITGNVTASPDAVVLADTCALPAHAGPGWSADRGCAQWRCCCSSCTHSPARAASCDGQQPVRWHPRFTLPPFCFAGRSSP